MGPEASLEPPSAWVADRDYVRGLASELLTLLGVRRWLPARAEGLTLVRCQGAATHRARLFPSLFPGDLGGAMRLREQTLKLSCTGNVVQGPDLSGDRDLGPWSVELSSEPYYAQNRASCRDCLHQGHLHSKAH